MDINQHPFLHKDPPSECRSFGSSYRECSQPRKISRGILIDSSAKFSSENANKGVMQSEEYLTPTKAFPVEVGNRIHAINSTDSGKHPLSVGHWPFPPVPTGSFHRGIPVSEVAHGSNESNCNENSLGKLISMATARKDANTTSQEVVIEDTAKEAENRGRETLRVKLWEILGTVSSPKQRLNDDLKVGAKDLESPQEINGERNLVLKSKQNSDTIENDSEFPNEKAIRLSTYSLSKKRAFDELKGNRSRNAQSSHYEEAEGNNTACFREGFSERISHGIHGGSLKKNKSEKQGSAEACKTIYLDLGNQTENKLVKNQRKVRPPGKRSFAHENGGGNYKEFFSGRNIEQMKPNSVALQRDTHGSPLMNLSDKMKSVTESPKLQENAEFIEDVDFSFLRYTTNKKIDTMSPIFEMRTPTKMSSPGFLPTEIKTPSEKFSDDTPRKSEPGVPDDCGSEGMAVEQRGILCFKSWLDCKSNFHRSNYQIYSSDDAGENDDAPTVKVEEHGTSISRSSNQESDSDTSEEDSQAKGCTEPKFHFLITGNDEKTNVLHLNKKRRYLDGSKTSGFSPTFASRKGAEELRNIEQHTDLKHDDGLPREIALFMLTLKRFKSKMNSVVEKRSAEILKSVAENINSQLKNVEYQMQVDAGKLVNHSKSKRKCLEIKYQELQGNLKTLHERFKEEANQHLQFCKTTVEGLEAQQMELKEKQRASSRKLLLQTQAAIDTELIDAQRKITMIRNSVREKMLQLKNIVADCLREGNFS